MPRGSKSRTSANLPCTQRGCPRTFRSESGQTNHVQTVHPKFDGHRLPVNPQKLIPESPTSSPIPSYSGGSPVMLPLPLQSPSPAPEQNKHEPEKNIPKLKRTYHPFLNGWFCTYIIFLKLYAYIFCKVNHAVQMGTTSLKEPPHLLELRRTVTTGCHLRVNLNLKLQIFCTAEQRCRKAILTTSFNCGIIQSNYGGSSPFESYQHIYNAIDAIEEGK